MGLDGAHCYRFHAKDSTSARTEFAETNASRLQEMHVSVGRLLIDRGRPSLWLIYIGKSGQPFDRPADPKIATAVSCPIRHCDVYFWEQVRLR